MIEPAKRFLTNETAIIQIYGRPETTVASIRNLSATGAYLEGASFENFRVGDVIRIKVPLKDVGRTHDISAEIKWIQDTEQSGAGICFIKESEVMTKIMNRF